MTLIHCTRVLAFDAGHRLREHEGKCRHLHGHRYSIEARFSANTQDDIGRIIDFGVITEKLGGWIDIHWDHGLILHEDDHAIGDALSEHIADQKIYYIPFNPTAENIGRYLLETICPRLFQGDHASCSSVIVRETPNCFAEIIG